MAINTSTYPYYDDFEEAKKFHKILYRPGFPVQARELTQQQSLLQNQINRLGSHIFKNGAMVIPGQITYDSQYHYVKIEALNPSSLPVGVDQFNNTIIIGESSGVKAEVINVTSADGTDPDMFFVKILNSGSDTESESFWDGETVNITPVGTIKAVVSGTLNISTPTYLNTGIGCASSIDAGIYFIDGNFVIVEEQTIIIDKFDNSPSVKIGLRIQDSIITPEDDITLLENAQGSPNYAAPGAHRYKINLVLSYVDLDDVTPKDFIELQRIYNGIVISEIRTTEYSELERTFARRTYDESGDYTVTPFSLDLKEYYKETDENDAEYYKYKEGKYTAAEIALQDPVLTVTQAKEKIALGVEPGKAYVRGFERNKLSTTWLKLDKARTFVEVNASIMNFNLGHYVYGLRMFNLPDLTTFPEIYLFENYNSSEDTNPAEEAIGTANIRAIQLYDRGFDADKPTDASGDGVQVDEYVYKIHLFNVNITATDKTLADVGWMSDDSTNGSVVTFGCVINFIDYATQTDYDAVSQQIVEPAKRKLIFPMPHNYIKTLVTGTQPSYTVQKSFTATVTAGNDLVFSAGTDTFDVYGTNYILMKKGQTTSIASYYDMDNNHAVSGSTFTVTNPGAGDYILIAPVLIAAISHRSKTLQTGHTQIIASPSTEPQGFNNLDRADGYKLVAVYESANTSTAPTTSDTDVTDKYLFDNGQRDSYYDLARIVLKPGETPPSGQLLVEFEYFSHGTTGGYFSVDSYPVEVTYDKIPVFHSEVGILFLSDCMDFRPVIDYDGSDFGTAGAIVNSLPIVDSNIRLDYQHYLSRRDKLSMDFAGEFAISPGIPAVVPEPPVSPDDGMVLYELFVEAYTTTPDFVKPVMKDNKRYTMKMIGDLDNRIGNLEYYSSLSLLEQTTAQLQITGDAGLDRFKNGFIVEPFTSHAIGDSASSEYKAAIDSNNGLMRPTFSSKSIDLEFDASNSANVTKTGALVTLDYTSTPMISQTLATKHENVNPFAVRLFKGEITFQPDSDNWYDTEKNGTLIVNDDAHYEALKFMADNSKGLNGYDWNDWQTSWSSTNLNNFSYDTVNRMDTGISHDEGWLQTTTTATRTTTTGKIRTGTRTTSRSTRINKDMGDRTVGMNYIPYMRSIPVLIKVTNMKPNTKLYAFFDDIDVSDYITPASILKISNRSVEEAFIDTDFKEESLTLSTGGPGTCKVVFDNGIFDDTNDSLFVVNASDDFISNVGAGDIITGDDSGNTATVVSYSVPTDLVTDSAGQLALIFNIPNNDVLKFRTGERVFKLTDQING